MKDWLYPGAKVVCVGVKQPSALLIKNIPSTAVLAKKGRTYTVRQVNVWPAATLILLEEIDNSHMVPRYGRIEPGFNATGFRPLQKRSTDAEVTKLKRLLNTTPADLESV